MKSNKSEHKLLKKDIQMDRALGIRVKNIATTFTTKKKPLLK